MKNLLLACESSCDETSFCIYNLDSNCIVSHSLYSQEIHKKFGGVIPEIASKEHLNIIYNLFQETLKNANLTIDDIEIYAATSGPGLPGALLIGSSFTKSLAWNKKKPFIPVNHLFGHICSSSIENKILYPHLCISVSGGHSSIYLVKNETEYETLGNTIDDAAGECFDKIAKLIGLPYPGGPFIEKYAQKNNYLDFYKFPRLKKNDLNFSFSGLKTAVLYKLIEEGLYDQKNKIGHFKETDLMNISSSLLVSIKDIILKKIMLAVENNKEIKGISFVGGVACNNFISLNIKNFCIKKNIEFYLPSKLYCTDNAGMIAKAASFLYKKNKDQYINFYNSKIL